MKHTETKGINNEQSISEPSGKLKQLNVDVIQVPERGKYRKVFEEIMVESFPNLVKIINLQIQEIC